jgi:hypothetical protein
MQGKGAATSEANTEKGRQRCRGHCGARGGGGGRNNKKGGGAAFSVTTVQYQHCTTYAVTIANLRQDPAGYEGA